MKYVVRTLLLSVLAVAALSCDKATPTAPDGSILTISANPSVVTSANGTSTITVTGRRSNGSPLADGTEIRLTTNLGNIEPIVRLDRNGTATATLRGDGRVGKATVTASASTSGTTAPPAPPPSEPGTTPPSTPPSTGTGILSASIDVEVGSSAKTMTLQATPTNIPVGRTSQVRLLALVRDVRGLPLANQAVNFNTEFGSLASGGRLIQTNAQGEARDTLTVRESDLANEPPDITVTAQTADSAGALVSSTFNIQVQSDRLDVSFTCGPASGGFTVNFNSTVSGGSNSLRYAWDFDDGTFSNVADPSHPFAAGNFDVVLTVTDNQSGLSDTARASITIPLTQGCSSD